MMRHALTLAFALTVIAHSIHAQSSEAFEAAVVRPSGPTSAFESTVTASQFIARRHALKMLIETSYPDLPQWRMSRGPSWAASELWDVVAKLPSGAPTDQERLYCVTEQMLRSFLAEEFRLKTHFVQEEQPVYDLVIAKGGSRLKPAEGTVASAQLTKGGVEIRHQTLPEFASFLFCPNCPRQRADRPVFDKTGLSGYYDLKLNWSPWNITSDDTAQGPSIFKPQPAKAPIDFLVIDQAERPPQN